MGMYRYIISATSRVSMVTVAAAAIFSDIPTSPDADAGTPLPAHLFPAEIYAAPAARLRVRVDGSHFSPPRNRTFWQWISPRAPAPGLPAATHIPSVVYVAGAARFYKPYPTVFSRKADWLFQNAKTQHPGKPMVQSAGGAKGRQGFRSWRYFNHLI